MAVPGVNGELSAKMANTWLYQQDFFGIRMAKSTDGGKRQAIWILA